MPSLSEGTGTGVPLTTRLRWLSIAPARVVSAEIAPSRAGMSMLTLLDMPGFYPRVHRLNPTGPPRAFLPHNDPVGRHTGSESASPPPRRARGRILLLSLLVTITLVAWGVLVFAAIDFGREARSGEPDAWTFLGLASLGAAACLFLTMILGSRLLAHVRGTPRPARVPGGHRAR